MLADFYKQEGNLSAIDGLIERANQLESLMKQPILDKLAAIRG